MSEPPDEVQRFEDLPEEVQWATQSLAMYAVTMDAAQFLEYKLAVLYGMIELRALSRRQTNPEKAMKQAFKRIQHAFQKASASELRRLLKGKVDDGMLDAVSPLIRLRDRLAHRYLREQYILSSLPYGQRMYDELDAMNVAFRAAHNLVDAETVKLGAPGTGDDEELLPRVEDVVRRLMYGDLQPPETG
jgi:hypothetical protein